MENLESFDIPSFKKGSGIRIKKKNRGKFTEYCNGKVTQKCIDKAKKSGNKTLVKRATFAENARAWKHHKGGQVLKFQNSGIIEIKDNVPIIIDEQAYEEPIINYPKLETPDWPLSYALNKNPRINHFKQLDNRSYTDESSPHTWLNSKHRWEIFRQNYAAWKGIPVEQVSLAESNKELGNLIYNSLLAPSYILDERSDYAEYFKQNPDVQGTHNPNDKEIVYRYETSPAKYGIHERTHAALPKALEFVISKIIPKINKYLDSSKEIYARLMELRKAYGIHPSKVWSLDEIKNLQKNATDVREGSSGHYDILNRYSPEQILLLFNNVAQNKSSNVPDLINPSEGLAYAKKGNKLIHKIQNRKNVLDSNLPKENKNATLVTKHSGGSVLKKIGKTIYGWTLPEYEGTFNEAFRLARINGDEKFRWNGEHYNTELAPHPVIEALKQWDTKGNLSKEEFKNQALIHPNDFINFYSKAYRTPYNRLDFDALYGKVANGFYTENTSRKEKPNLGLVIYSNLSDGWDPDQIYAALGNSYVETGGWSKLTQLEGPAEGLFMMEPPLRKAYTKWLKSNNLNKSEANQVNYVLYLFDTRDESLQTPWSRLPLALNDINEILKNQNKNPLKNELELYQFVKSLKSADEAKKYGLRSAWLHQDYTTELAWKDWKHGDLDAKTKAFEALFERAGMPHMDRRYYLAHLIKKNSHIYSNNDLK